MTPPTRPSRVVEWAELVGDSVPDVVRDADAAAPERSPDARWADTRSSNSQ